MSADLGFGKVIPERQCIGRAMNKVNNAKELGALVRQRRKQAGLTLKDAAGMAGVGIRFISELERGKPTLQLGLAILYGKTVTDRWHRFARPAIHG